MALLEVEGLAKHYPTRRSWLERLGRKPPAVLRAVDRVSFAIPRGTTLGLIGESGCGKSTLGRTLLRLQEPSAGRVRFDGTELTGLAPARLKPLRRRLQIIFQDPYASLNPRHPVREIVGLPLAIHERLTRREARERVAQMIARVGLSPDHLDRYPHQFSGGQRQRIGIARALILNPDLVVCDEPVSALDVSIQAQILRLLLELKQAMGLTYLFISHDLAVVAQISDRIAVMYLGEIVELGPTRRLIAAPAHPYSRALLAAVPRLDGHRTAAAVPGGEPPSPLDPPPGCKFHPRCPHAIERCRRVAPKPQRLADDHEVACHLYGEAA